MLLKIQKQVITDANARSQKQVQFFVVERLLCHIHMTSSNHRSMEYVRQAIFYEKDKLDCEVNINLFPMPCPEAT